MHIDDVRTFVAVSETGSLSVAARALHLTQPAVTRRLQRLEQAVGAPLVDRRRRRFALTDVGRAALERCRRLVAAADDMEALGHGAPLPARECRLGVAHALTEVALTDPLDDVHAAYPGVTLRLSTGWSADMMARVRAGGLDAALVLLPEGHRPPAGTHGEILADEELLVIAPRATARRARTPADLGRSAWLLNPEGCAGRAALLRCLGRARQPLHVAMETYDYELQMRLVARGRGLGLVPSRLLARSPSRAALARVGVTGFRFPFPIWLVTGDSASAVAPVITAFREAVSGRVTRRARGRAEAVHP
ncbi:MAG: LysR family transcriptional regulator [Vicinamibacterales bacterium]